MPYAKLKTTYNPYQGAPNNPQFGATPPGWWAIIGSNKDQATVINPDSPISTSGTCKDFSTSWSREIDVKQGPIPYYYDSTSDPGTLTCITTQTGDIRTPVLTCSGASCCGGDGLNGLIPAGVTFQGMVRPDDTSKPQCIEKIGDKYLCSDNGTCEQISGLSSVPVTGRLYDSLDDCRNAPCRATSPGTATAVAVEASNCSAAPWDGCCFHCNFGQGQNNCNMGYKPTLTKTKGNDVHCWFGSCGDNCCSAADTNCCDQATTIGTCAPSTYGPHTW